MIYEVKKWLQKLRIRFRKSSEISPRLPMDGKKQLTYTSWNNRGEKFDLRSWNEEHTAMTKGLTLTKDEMMKLRDILNDIDFDKYES